MHHVRKNDNKHASINNNIIITIIIIRHQQHPHNENKHHRKSMNGNRSYKEATRQDECSVLLEGVLAAPVSSRLLHMKIRETEISQILRD